MLLATLKLASLFRANATGKLTCHLRILKNSLSHNWFDKILLIERLEFYLSLIVALAQESFSMSFYVGLFPYESV